MEVTVPLVFGGQSVALHSWFAGDCLSQKNGRWSNKLACAVFWRVHDWLLTEARSNGHGPPFPKTAISHAHPSPPRWPCRLHDGFMCRLQVNGTLRCTIGPAGEAVSNGNKSRNRNGARNGAPQVVRACASLDIG